MRQGWSGLKQIPGGSPPLIGPDFACRQCAARHANLLGKTSFPVRTDQSCDGGRLNFRPRAAAAIAFPRSHPFLQAVCWARSYSAYISSTVMASCRSVTQTSLLCFEAGDDGFCLLDVWGHDHHHGGGSQAIRRAICGMPRRTASGIRTIFKLSLNVRFSNHFASFLLGCAVYGCDGR